MSPGTRILLEGNPVATAMYEKLASNFILLNKNVASVADANGWMGMGKGRDVETMADRDVRREVQKTHDILAKGYEEHSGAVSRTDKAQAKLNFRNAQQFRESVGRGVE